MGGGLSKRVSSADTRQGAAARRRHPRRSLTCRWLFAEAQVTCGRWHKCSTTVHNSLGSVEQRVQRFQRLFCAAILQQAQAQPPAAGQRQRQDERQRGPDKGQLDARKRPEERLRRLGGSGVHIIRNTCQQSARKLPHARELGRGGSSRVEAHAMSKLASGLRISTRKWGQQADLHQAAVGHSNHERQTQRGALVRPEHRAAAPQRCMVQWQIAGGTQ